MNSIIWKGVSSTTIKGLIISELPPISKPKMRIKETEIDGRDGSIVEELGYEKPQVALEYISDNNWEMYKNPQPVVAGTSSRNGRTLKFVNWQNVVAYEVADKDGNLIFISEGLLNADQTASFAIDTDWQEGFKVYAVSAKGERTEINL